MTIQLPPEIEHLLIAKVESGLFPSIEDAMTKAAYLLLEQIEQAKVSKTSARTKDRKIVEPTQPMSLEELHQRMIASGKIARLPDTAADFDDPEDELIAIEGEPLSETIIRERR